MDCGVQTESPGSLDKEGILVASKRKKKPRESIPSELAARVLFLTDRTCCVCRIRGKPVQIHHIDGNPSHNSLENLAVLCFDCHRDTQVRGGFDRKLDSEQVILYQDNWHRIVALQRVPYQVAKDADIENTDKLELVTSIAEIYRENQEFELLAMHYHAIGNKELRDKYVELAIEKSPHDQTICHLRGLQGKPELIPQEIIDRELKGYIKTHDWSQRARFYKGLGRHREAVVDYIQGIGESLQQDNVFSAAFYLKELTNSGLIEEIFVLALKQFEAKGDLWWQVRAYQELGWDKELDDLVSRNAEEINQSDNPLLRMLLADAKGEKEDSIELRKAMAKGTHMAMVGDNLGRSASENSKGNSVGG